MEIPARLLSDEALRGVVLEFVSREGTDYGPGEWSMEDKVDQVLAQLARGEVVILADPETGSCNLVPSKDARRAVEMLEHREALERRD